MSGTAPPRLPNYDFVRELGRGGFADVFLYRQRLPSRDVAVKVLRQTAQTRTDQEQFENEANRMAMLSSHPGIVTIYEVGVSPDDRPYLTMEFCPNDHLGTIVRRQPLSAARALEVGVKVAGAVGSAHRAGILHRDIKPANVLITAYQEPALTDFGIAGVREGDALADSQGVSVPFAAPEVLRGLTAGDERSDVYALGATVYALLAGRSPFSTANTSDGELLERILHALLPSLGRDDVPPSLERVLAHAMARDPGQRISSVAAFGRALQGIEAELGLAQTPLRITEDGPRPDRRPDRDDDDDSTRLRSIQRVDPGGPVAAEVAIAAVPQHYDVPHAEVKRTDLPIPAQPAADHTVPARPRASHVDAEAAVLSAIDDPARSRTALLATLSGAAVLVVLALVIVFVSRGADGGVESGTTTTTADPDAFAVAGPPSAPERVVVEPDGEGNVGVRWTPVDRAADDTFRVVITSGEARSAPGGSVDTEDPSVVLEGVEGRVCVEVLTRRSGDISSVSAEACSDDG